MRMQKNKNKKYLTFWVVFGRLVASKGTDAADASIRFFCLYSIINRQTPITVRFGNASVRIDRSAFFGFMSKVRRYIMSHQELCVHALDLLHRYENLKENIVRAVPILMLANEKISKLEEETKEIDWSSRAVDYVCELIDLPVNELDPLKDFKLYEELIKIGGENNE